MKPETNKQTQIGPRPRRRPSWVEQQRKRRRDPFYRLLDRSFGFRLLIAATAAGLLLGGVNRWEHCRQNAFKPGCFLADPGGVVSVGNIEALSIVSAAFVYLLETGQRRRRAHLEAMEVIQACNQMGARFSHARNEALELLSESGLWLDGLDLSGAQMEEIRAPYARWRGVNLKGADLRKASLHDADLQGSNLQNADLSGADLRYSNLSHADLSGANLNEARLDGAKLERLESDSGMINDQIMNRQNS
jgi:hypothetical protein